jgi:Rrf2 family protein
MAIFNAKVEYALRAVLDLAGQPAGVAAQSREIAQRQSIPEAYLDQVLSLLRRHGLVRSIRGAGGGYVIGRPPHEISVAEVVRACNGADLIVGSRRDVPDECAGASVVRSLSRRVDRAVQTLLEGTSLRDLRDELQSLDESQSLMAGI